MSEYQYIWDCDEFDIELYNRKGLVINVDGPPLEADAFGNEYTTYALEGRLLTVEEMLTGLAEAYATIKREGDETGMKKVYFVWRERPYDFVSINGGKFHHVDPICRLNIYTEHEYKELESELMAQGTKEASSK